jgi:tRNA threonylcarbamoyl adenosine modification protein YeaZ
MSHIITVQSTYQSIELGLFDGIQCLDEQIIDKKNASGQCMHMLEALCNEHKWRLPDVACIVASQGPGPFTTLRTVIASVNGLSFAAGIPLIGINALEALIVEFDPDTTKNVLAILNAFAGNVYYGIQYAGIAEVVIGVGEIGEICATIHADTIHVIGNAIALYGNIIEDTYGTLATIHADILHASLKTVAHMGIKQWRDNQKGEKHLSPLYLKSYSVS